MPERRILSKKKIILLGLLAIFIILGGYISYIRAYKYNKKFCFKAPHLVLLALFPPEYPNNPSNVPLVTNYTIIIPKGLYTGGDIPSYKVSMKFIAPLPSLQSQENWTITNCTAGNRHNHPILLQPGQTKQVTSYNPASYAQILPYVFNGTTIDVKVDVYGYNGFDVQLVYSKEWNVTEYVYA